MLFAHAHGDCDMNWLVHLDTPTNRPQPLWIVRDRAPFTSAGQRPPSSFCDRGAELQKLECVLPADHVAIRLALLEVGPGRLLYSVDYPYETVQEQTDWFDSLPISETDRHMIGRQNALELLKLSFPVAK